MEKQAQTQTHYIETASDVREAQHLVNRQRLRWVRAAVAVVGLGLAAAVVGSAAHATHVYNQTSFAVQYYLPLWPAQLSDQSTTALVTTGSIIALASLVLLIATVLPGPSSRTTQINALATLSGVVGIIASVFGVAYSRTLDNNATTYTIRTWTCRWTDLLQTAPLNFQNICRQTKAAVDLMIALIVVEALLLALGALGFWMEGRMNRARMSIGRHGKVSPSQLS